MGLSLKSNYEKRKFIVLTSGKFLEALGSGIGTGSIFCLSFSLSNRVIQLLLTYRFLDNHKSTRSQFSIPGLWEIHRNLKQQKNFNSRDGFFRKSPFCTFSSINPGFVGPRDMLQKKFLIAIFTMLQKNIFGLKKWKIAKMALLNPCMKFEIFLTKSILLMHYENGNKKKYP